MFPQFQNTPFETHNIVTNNIQASPVLCGVKINHFLSGNSSSGVIKYSWTLVPVFWLIATRADCKTLWGRPSVATPLLPASRLEHQVKCWVLLHLSMQMSPDFADSLSLMLMAFATTSDTTSSNKIYIINIMIGAWQLKTILMSDSSQNLSLIYSMANVAHRTSLLKIVRTSLNVCVITHKQNFRQCISESCWAFVISTRFF